MAFNLKNRNVAKGIMVASIVIGSIGGNGISLGKEKSKVEDYFFYGEDGICINNDLNDMANELTNITVIADKYDIDTINAKALAKDIKNNHSIKEKYKIMNEMNEEMKTIYLELNDEDLSENHKKLAKAAYTDYHSSANIISHDPYNEKATSYNSLLKKNPNRMFRLIHRAKELELFE